MEDASYEYNKDAARKIYFGEPSIRSPFFNDDVDLGFVGFQHLQYSSHGERSQDEQVRRFNVLPIALQVLRTATTVQEYRKDPDPSDARRRKQKAPGGPTVQWWGFVANYVQKGVKIRVVVRKVGAGRLHFWSLMLCPKDKPQNTRHFRHAE